MHISLRRFATAVLLGAAISLLAEAADLVKPDIRPGLWEVTTSPQVSGQLPIPEEELAKLTPEQRARMEAALTKGMAQPRVYKECMTKEKIAQGFDAADPRAGTCQRNVIASSSSELHIREDCNRAGTKSTVDVHFQLSGGVQMTGTVNAVMSAGSRTMTMNSKIEGKWVAASCGSVKDAEPEK